MELNKYARAFGFVVLGCLGSFQVNAFTGPVIYRPSPSNADLIERARTSTARVSPELDATYQRTMRNSMTRAAALKAGVGLIRGLQVISTIGVLVTLASDMHGIWTKKIDGTNEFSIPSSTACEVGPCYQYKYTSNGGAGGSFTSLDWSTTPDSAVRATIGLMPTYDGKYAYRFGACNGADTYSCYHILKTRTYINEGAANQTTEYADSNVGGTLAKRSVEPVAFDPNGPKRPVTDLELGELVKADPLLIPLLKQLDDAGAPLLYPDPDVEDMPQPLVLSPKTTIHPDGSKTIEQTTLTPYRGPDGKSINWERKAAVVEESPPDSAGNTIKKTTTTTSDSAPTDAKTDERPECEKSPDTLGCIKMDTPGGDIPKTTKDVSYVAESLFGAATCPVSRVISQSLTGHPIYLHFTPTCDALATFVKPMVIAIALFMAYLIILPGNRE